MKLVDKCLFYVFQHISVKKSYLGTQLINITKFTEKFFQPPLCVNNSPISLDSKQRRDSQFAATNFLRTADRENLENKKE